MMATVRFYTHLILYNGYIKRKQALVLRMHRRNLYMKFATCSVLLSIITLILTATKLF